MSLYDRPHGTPRRTRAVTLREAAERLAVTPDTLRQQINAGRLRAIKHGPIWWISAGEVARYQREQLGRPGRKPAKRRPT